MTFAPLRKFSRRARNFYRHGIVRSETALSAILTSGLFDLGFYNAQLSMQFKKQRDAVQHYIAEGEAAGFNPNPFFDADWYRATYPDVVARNGNALADFVSRAPEFDRNPSRGFDCTWYLSQYPDVAAAGVNPLQHFAADGHREGRVASPLDVDALAPARGLNLIRMVTPQEGAMLISGRFDVRPVPDDLRSTGTWDAAAADKSDFVDGSRAKIFPPKPYTAVFRNVGTVGGTRLVITDSDTVLSDEIAAFRDSSGWNVRPHDYKIDSAAKLSVALERRYPSHITRGAHLMHEYASNYFHMITELLPRLIAAEDAGLDPDLPLLIQEGLHPNLLELLGVINSKGRQLIPLRGRQIYTVDELHFISDVSSIQDVYERRRLREETVLHRGLTRRLADEVIAALAPGAPPQRTRRIYIRRGSRYRGLLNEQAVEEMLIREGFEVVLVDGLSVSAQIALFRQAKLIVAPTGAAVTNILWCQPGTPVCVLSAKHDAMPVEIWFQLGEIAGCSVTSLTCDRAYERDDIYSMHDDYTVDLDLLGETIGRLEATE